MVDVLVFGSAITDFICYVPRLPKAGETLHGKRLDTGFGGKGANQCVAAAKLGAHTAMIAKLGGDSWGINYYDNLKKLNVNISFVEKLPKETTGVAQISVADNGENQIVIVAGANNCLSKKDVDKAQELFEKSKILVCQLETPIDATIYALEKFCGVSILNAAPALENPPLELLQKSTIFCVNENEAMMTTKMTINSLLDAKRAIQRMIELGANTVILTMGEQGAIYGRKYESNCIHVEPLKVKKVVDTTGAGDAFIGSLAYYIAKFPDVELHQQIGAANLAAAYSVQYPGTQSSFAAYKDVCVDFNSTKFKWATI